ncbi:GNAT family protein [Martelella radicis]|uniref:RimJ/RimL family protein N-acetyltransferase n=1 Tax=Martelella radicis TaxID=1397476 RepID=A0A7W6KLV3_9HYPH|nr:RimJ/RimL family protein N-acetyltransferase [Martelella radicis]
MASLVFYKSGTQGIEPLKTIQTDRLSIRNFRVGDAETLFAYLREPVASCFFSLKLADLAAAEREVLKRAGDDEYVAVCLKESGQLIGDLFIHPDPAWPDDPEKPQQPDTVSVGWNFNPLFSGKGYALEAAEALFAELFIHQSTRRIYAYVEDHNASSRRLCEKLGMRVEGLFLEYVTFQNDSAGNPIYENTMQYAILRHEWDRH